MGNLSAPRPVSKIQTQAKLKLAWVGCGSRLAKARQWAGACAKHVVGKLEGRTVEKIDTLNERFQLHLLDLEGVELRALGEDLFEQPSQGRDVPTR